MKKSGIDIFQKKYIVIPINRRNAQHWIMMVLMNMNKIITTNKNKCKMIQKSKILIFDSNHTYEKAGKYCEKICEFLNYEWFRLNKQFQSNNRAPFNCERMNVFYPEGKYFVLFIIIF